MAKTGRGAKVLQFFKYSLLFIATIALVKIAFFPSNEEPILEAEGNFEQPTTELTPNKIDSTTKLSATILRNSPTPIRATASGEVVAIFPANGSPVGSGEQLIQVKKVTMPESAATGATGTGASGIGAAGTAATTDGSEESASNPSPQVSYHNIASPTYGTVNLNVVLGQTVEAGMEIGTITPNAFHAIAQIKPSQLYSLGENLSSGKLTITDGPAPFLCDEVRVISSSDPAPAPAMPSGDPFDSGAASSAGSTSGGPMLRCDIPSSQTVYEGLTASLDLGGSTTGEVLTLPVTAVEGRFKEGYVFTPAAEPGKKPQKVKVQLGVHDGTNIEIKGGLKEGQQVLMFVPAAADDDDTPDSTSDNK